MKRLLPFVLAGAVLAGCGSGNTAVIDKVPPRSTHVAIPAELPPSPATWPAYPKFSQPSCWARPFLSGDTGQVQRDAPSYLPPKRAHPVPPQTVAKRLLARLGDRRYVKSIVFEPAPPAVGSNVHVLYAGGHPPKDALTATIVSTYKLLRHPTPIQNLADGIASFESGVVGGALRDDMCAAGGAPLVRWTSADGGGFSESGSALGQRFPNPSPAAFRKRVALVGRRYGFRVVSLTLLKPEQIAPVVVVRTSEPRKVFAKDVGKIVPLLDPTNEAKHQGAQTFEAFFFAAEDSHGPFLWTESISRGELEGGEWAANQCLYPYPTLGGALGVKQKPCP